MDNAQAGLVLRQLRRIAGRREGSEPTDGQLLEGFVARHEEAAFATLVRRHGPLVLGVCRRVLEDDHDAEDAFQATFMVLVRRAGALDRSRPLGSWLYTVAYHIALKARASGRRRRAWERQVRDMAPAESEHAIEWRELRPVLDEELDRLPEKYREAFVLCNLQGKTNREVARQLGLPAGTVKSRLARARELLRQRLTRRGVMISGGLIAALVAEKATAAVPSVLAEAAVKSSLRYAVGQTTPGPAAALAEGVLKTMFATKFKLATLVLMAALVVSLGIGLWAQGAGGRKEMGGRAGEQAAPAKREPTAKGRRAQPARSDVGPELVLTGRVVTQNRKAIAGAAVAVVGLRTADRPTGPARQVTLAQGATDGQGRFRLAASVTWQQFHSLHVLASARGYGLEWRSVAEPGKGRRGEMTLALRPEQVVRGRLLDLQGSPAAQVRLRVLTVLGDPPHPIGGQVMIGGGGGGAGMDRMMRRPDDFSFQNGPPQPRLLMWPKPVVADEKGRFRVAGFGRGRTVELLVEDDRFARQELLAEAGNQKEVVLTLAPPQQIEGRVRCEDTGKPVAGARIQVASFRAYQSRMAEGQADAQGRFRIHLHAGDDFGVSVFAPEGAPYLGRVQRVRWPKGAVRKTIDVRLPRGVVIGGKVAEGASGKPVAGARVYFHFQEPNPAPADVIDPRFYPATSGPDGSFRQVVPHGIGHLLCEAGDKKFIHQTISVNELLLGRPGGSRRYFHAVMPLTLEAGKDVKDLVVRLRRGVTLRGRLEGPGGQAVRRAVVFCPGELVMPDTEVFSTFHPAGGNIPRVLIVQDGTFELAGCDPDRTYRIFVLDIPASLRFDPAKGPAEATVIVNRLLLAEARQRYGAAIDLSAQKASGKPVAVQLQACGSAEARFVDGQAKPVKTMAWLELVVTPREGTAGREPEVIVLGSPHEWPPKVRPFVPDAQGRVRMPALIGGATYRLRVYGAGEGRAVQVERVFRAEAGKMTKLGAIAVPEK
jgi:RNA polymerase sigma factor (sigma-70 family)